MNPTLTTLLAEGETAQIRLERSRLAEESAKNAIEIAKIALDTAKAETALSIIGRDEVIGRAEAVGMQRKPFRALIEDRVTALVNSGLFNLADAAPTPVAAPKPKATRRREADVSVPVDIQPPAVQAEVVADEQADATAPISHEHVSDASEAVQVDDEAEAPEPEVAVSAPPGQYSSRVKAFLEDISGENPDVDESAQVQATEAVTLKSFIDAPVADETDGDADEMAQAPVAQSVPVQPAPQVERPSFLRKKLS